MISSRRKSCSACARGKRRCDLGFPQCGRCLARRATCVYAWITPQEAQEVAKTINTSLWVPQEGLHNALGQSGPTETFQSSDDSPRPGEHQANNHTIFCPVPLTLSSAAVPLLDEITGRGRTISFFAPGPQLPFLNKACSDVGSDVHAPRPPHNIDIPQAPSQGANGSSIYTSKIFQARAEYAASRLVHQVRTLAETGQTSFIHHSQVNCSAILRDAFAVSSLTETCNLANESLILSEITRRAGLLIEATETAISMRPPSPHSAIDIDLLPAVQAMLIYQCIRLLSTGDISQQTQAELDGMSLARWVDILQEQTQWSCDYQPSSTQLDLSVWKGWVQAESIRRTMIFAELLNSIHTFLRFGLYQPSLRMAKLNLTGQVAIWEARSPAEWHQARCQKPWVELNILSFHNGIKTAFPDDLDELGIIILTT
ncbi:hypothetical protein FHETE_11162 [Fusarium heterosporum]|uniref:Zn(2)-C6 fungal-type domain-containing protein n=1 Tax=Fusarium heterosporum TaxID=42747 RepID=A0A8H5SRQ1_FUSHE|nr:hypothetical protein FHETE_11162 [Fusarium heterosporum]